MRNPGNQAAIYPEPASAGYLSGDTVECTMFSCCLLTTRGSDLRNSHRRRLAGVWRRWIYPRLQRLWPFSHRHMEMIQHSQVQDDTGLSETESAQTLEEPCRGTCISADKLEKLVNHLVPSLQGGDPFFVPAFLFTYRRFITTQQVLDLLFKRYGFFHPHCKEDEQVKTTICTFLETWLNKNPEDFCQSSDLSILNQLMAYLLLNMPCSELATRVHVLLSQLEDQTSCESEDKNLGSRTSADPELKEHLLATKSATLEPEPAGAREPEITKAIRGIYATGANCGGSSLARSPADCCGSWICDGRHSAPCSSPTYSAVGLPP